MRRTLARCALLSCAALMNSNTVHAQARAVAPDPPVLPEKKVQPPCSIWSGQAWRTICLARIRSKAFSSAWASGTDEQGVRLDAAMRARKQTETEIWLRRLGGTFRVEGTYSNSGGSNPVRGTAHCLGVGDGPAAPCVISATWKAPKESYKEVELDRALYQALESLVILIGVDPGESQVRATLMDYRAVRMSSFLIDGVAVFEGELPEMVFPAVPNKTTPANPLVPYFWSSVFIAINPDGEVVIKISVEPADGINMFSRMIRRINPGIQFDLHLHRETKAP